MWLQETDEVLVGTRNRRRTATSREPVDGMRQSAASALPQAPYCLDALGAYEEHCRQRRGATASALFVIHRGQIAAQSYYGKVKPTATAPPVAETSRFNVYSIRKTYIGLAVSYLLARKSIEHLDVPVADFLTDPGADVLKGTTVRHLLTHTHGLDEGAGRIYRRFAAGTRWQYNNTGTNLLCALFTVLAGCSVRQWLYDSVWEPLAFLETDFADEACATLVQDVNSFARAVPLLLDQKDGSRRNLYVSARELALWGYLHLRQGALPGESRLPAQWFTTATDDQTPATLDVRYPHHGFYWWLKNSASKALEIGANVPDDAYQIVGMSGCICLVIPSLDVVAVRMHNSLGGRLSFTKEARGFGDALMSALEPYV